METSSAADTSSTPTERPRNMDNPLEDPANPAANSGEKGTLYYINWNAMSGTGDLRTDTTQQYDALGFITALQGILNREKPVMYVYWQGETDIFWYKYLRREGKLLYGYKQVSISSLDQFMETFKDEIVECGLTEWDPDVPATSNVAITACGVTNQLPVRSGGKFTEYVKEKTGAKVKLDLKGKFTGKGKIPDTNRQSSGSKKCDAYIWAMEQYMDKTTSKILGYMLDAEPWGDVPYPDLGNAFVPNRDYIIAQKAFVFDLSPWDDEAPCDDPDQPIGTDVNTLKEILSRTYDKNNGDVFTVCGFVPWQRKYTGHLNKSSHVNDVAAEWRYAEIISCYNGVMDAEAAAYCGMSNASVYSLYPLKEKYEKTPAQPAMEYDPRKKYVYLYMGDYDSSAWMKMAVAKMWNDGGRGQVVINWPFNPNLSDRIPMVFDYVRETATDKDYFVAGDSGAGYLNPSLLFDRIYSDKPAGDQAFIKHNKYYYEKFDINFTSFLINGVHEITDQVKDMFLEFSPLGAITAGGLSFQEYKDAIFIPHRADMPEKDFLAKDIEKNANFIIQNSVIRDKTNLFVFRFILWRPSELQKVMDRVTEKTKGSIVFCDPENFVEMGHQAWANINK